MKYLDSKDDFNIFDIHKLSAATARFYQIQAIKVDPFDVLDFTFYGYEPPPPKGE